MSDINISDVVKKLLTDSEAALQPILVDATKEGLDAAATYLSNLEARGTSLLQVVADPDYTGDKLAFVVARIKDEPTILETEVFSFIIIGESIAQAAINSIEAILIDAVHSILPSTP